MTTVTGSFTVLGGTEQVIRETPGGLRLTRVGGTQQFSGSISGQGSVDWVFCYSPNGSGEDLLSRSTAAMEA